MGSRAGHSVLRMPKRGLVRGKRRPTVKNEAEGGQLNTSIWGVAAVLVLGLTGACLPSPGVGGGGEKATDGSANDRTDGESSPEDALPTGGSATDGAMALGGFPMRDATVRLGDMFPRQDMFPGRDMFSGSDMSIAFDASPAPQADASVRDEDMQVDPAPVAFAMCTATMVSAVQRRYAASGCDDYTDQEKADQLSPYHLERVVAGCLRQSCEGGVVGPNNGILAARSCSQLRDLQRVLEVAAAEALEAQCLQPRLQMRVLSLEDFVGGEACDEYICGIGEDGRVIAVDNSQ